MGLIDVMTPEAAAQEEQWAKDIKYHAARWAWRHRNKTTPKGVTWESWFEARFGESLNEFADRHRKDKSPPAPNNG